MPRSKPTKKKVCWQKKKELVVEVVEETVNGLSDVSGVSNTETLTSKSAGASHSKLSLNPGVSVEKNTGDGSVIFDLDCLQTLFAFVSCPSCVSAGSVTITEVKRMGCAVLYKLSCRVCGFESATQYSSKRQGQSFEVNRRMVYAMRLVGCGQSEATTFNYLMDLPSPPNAKAYAKHVAKLSTMAEHLAGESMKEAAYDVAKSNPSRDCGASFDGSWQRRGFSSLNGVVTAISIDTGKVLDTEVLTKYCKTCEKHAADDKTTPEYVYWKAGHDTVCDINYTGSSASMETVGAVRIFLRSEQERGLRYTDYYGDGDSKSYSAVVAADPYVGKTVLKKECVGHYQKRLGTALRKLAKEKKLGGKGKLTSAKIDRMQNYFGMALRANTSSVEVMSRAIMGTMFHLSSRDDQPLHSKCPLGKTSWCGFQRAKALGVQYKHRPGLPIEVVRAIKPTYERLVDPAMLSKCLHGMTQNNNESFNGMIWRRCPKETYVGRKTMKLGVYDAVSHFNSGAKVELNLYRRLFITPGKNMLAGVRKADARRITKCAKQTTPVVKTQRKYLRGRKKMRSDKQATAEGVTYQAGAFD